MHFRTLEEKKMFSTKEGESENIVNKNSFIYPSIYVGLEIDTKLHFY